MKKAFPVLWRYILVVITSCVLAFFISQNTAKAAKSVMIKKIQTLALAGISSYLWLESPAYGGAMIMYVLAPRKNSKVKYEYFYSD